MRAVTEREHLVRPGGLLAFVGVVGLVLYLLFPREIGVTSLDKAHKADALSIAYLQLLLHSYPENDDVRYQLARQLHLAGDDDRALAVLQAVKKKAKFLEQPRWAQLYLAILLKHMYAARSQAERVQRQQKLAEATARLLYSPLAEDRKRIILEEVLPGLPLAARIDAERWLLQHATDEREAAKWRQQLFNHLLAAGRHEEAMRVFEQMAQRAPVKDRLKWDLERVRRWLAAGRPDRALEAAVQLVTRHPKNVEALQLALNVARQNGRLDLQQRWMARLLRLRPRDRALAWQLFQLEVGEGRLEAALKRIPQLGPPEKLSALQLKRIAQVHDWTGRVREGLHWWLRYARRTDRVADWRRTWRLAIGLGQLDVARSLLEKLQRRRPLTEEERDQLYGVYIALGETDKAHHMLELALQRHPDDRRLAVRLYQLLVDMDELAEATAVLLGLEAQGLLTPALRVELANLLWLQRAPELAYATLLRAERIQSDRYWQRRLELAAYLEQFEDAAAVLWRLLRDGKMDTFVRDQLPYVAQGLVLVHKPVAAARLLFEGYRRTQNIELGLQAAALALQAGKVRLARQWLSQIEKPKAQALLVRWWSLQAQLALRENRVDDGVAAWEQAHVLAPADQAVLEGLMWTLIDHVDRYDRKLRTYLDFLSMGGARRPVLQPLLAYGYLALGEYANSLRWFRIGLPQHRQDADWLMAMATALDKTGYHAYARRLQAYVWRMLRPKLLAGALKGYPAAQTLRLARDLKGSKAADVLARMHPQQLDEAGRLQLVLEWALADGQRIWAHYYLQRALAHGVALPGWQRLALALDDNDGMALEWALRHFSRLPVADRVYAQQLLGRRTAALAEGLSELDARKDAQTVSQIRAMTASVRSGLDNGFRISKLMRHRAALTGEGWGVTLARLYDEHAVTARVTAYSLRGEDPLLPGLGDQIAAYLGWRRWGRDWELSLATHYIDRRQRRSWGGRMAWTRQLDTGLSYRLTAALNERADYSDVLWGWGHDSFVRLNVDYGLDSRTRLAAEVDWHREDSAWGVTLGEGPRLAGSVTFMLFAHDPTWEVSADVQWFRFSGNPLADARLNALFVTPPDDETVLAREYGRVGLASTWYHGQVHRIAHEVPSPRWKFGLSLGYTWTRQVLDYGVEAGLGWRIEGDDELGLTFAFNNETIAGGPAFEVKLSYNRYMGR